MRGQSLCFPGVSFVSQDMPAPLPHPSDPTDPTDPTDSPETTHLFKSLISPDPTPRCQTGYIATRPAHQSIQPQQRKK
jgi:hypothetical protein